MIFYVSSVALLGALALGLWAYASHAHRPLRPDTTEVFVTLSLWRGGTVATVFALSIPVARINARARECCWPLIVVANVTPAPGLRAHLPRLTPQRDPVARARMTTESRVRRTGVSC